MKFYVTTSIPYVNNEPHIGFGMELVQADILARYWRAQGVQVLFSAGTDEHGGKIAEKAAEAKLEPKVFADQISQKFVDVLKVLNISNDRFIRTTDQGHEQRAQLIWQKLFAAGHIYKGKYNGWYCTGHEEYFPQKLVKANKGVCPDHNRPYEKLEEENYFFKASAFSGQVNKAISSGIFRVVPDSRKNEILSVLKAGLADTSISRPKDKISWGIGVPGDETQVIYVWFEALMNYITVLGYPEHSDFKTFWPADVQVIGKDILRFHAAIWPAMLLALRIELPKALYVHGFVNIDHQKISKTLGNVITPAQVVEKYGADATRYFLARHIPSYGDGDFTWGLIEAAYNSELADQLGNAVSRTAAMVSKYQNGIIGEVPAPEHDVAAYAGHMQNYRFDRALDRVWEQVKGLNQYVDESKPWEIAKTKDEEHLREVLAYLVSNLLEIAVLVAPFMPETAAKINQTFSSGVLKPLPGPLFPKHETTTIPAG